MDHRKPFLENKSLFTKWFKHELTGKTSTNGIGMMEKVANDKKDDNTVEEVLQKGYKLVGRVIKPALVVVIKNKLT